MKKNFMKILFICIILLALSSCKSFRLSTENSTIEVESAHMRYLSVICADDTIFGV